MNEIIEMVNQVGCKSYTPPPTRAVAGVSMTFAQLEAFYKLAVAKEREACAKVCEEVGEHPSLTPQHCAESIRARGEA